MRNPFIFFLAGILALTFFCCRKDSFITSGDASLSASADTLHFDTLFTSTGSTTQYFKVFNNNNRKLLVGSISLTGGSASYYKINADGFTGPEINNLEMEANDSLYVFVTVTIDPNSENLPFVVEDSIRIVYNGKEAKVQLQAWGQNANFYRSRLITGNTIWTNNKPYVITGGLLVDKNATLTIEKGTHIYLHADAPFLVEGKLVAEGEQYDSTRIVFQGDRLDAPYNSFPGAWPGIYFRNSSKDNRLNYVIIKNAYQGIVAEAPSTNANPKLLLQNTIIDNAYDAGITGVQTAIDANNCLVSNCGKNIQLLYGGIYRFTHCTDVAYSNEFVQHKQPALTVTDYVESGNAILSTDLEALFTNCIFWGDQGTVDDEVVTAKQGSGLFSVDFSHCLWKVKNQPAGATVSGLIENQDPLFLNTDSGKPYNFRLSEGSPGLDQGAATVLSTDLDGLPRNISSPDLGAYERP